MFIEGLTIFTSRLLLGGLLVGQIMSSLKKSSAYQALAGCTLWWEASTRPRPPPTPTRTPKNPSLQSSPLGRRLSSKPQTSKPPPPPRPLQTSRPIPLKPEVPPWKMNKYVALICGMDACEIYLWQRDAGQLSPPLLQHLQHHVDGCHLLLGRLLLAISPYGEGGDPHHRLLEGLHVHV